MFPPAAPQLADETRDNLPIVHDDLQESLTSLERRYKEGPPAVESFFSHPLKSSNNQDNQRPPDQKHSLPAY
jgi:hypothetical protein